MTAERGAFGFRDWLSWILACGVGEALGLVAVVGVDLLLRLLLDRSVLRLHGLLSLLLLVGLGVLEGLIIGYCQWTVLGRRYPSLRLRRWLRVTVWAGGLAWFLGTLPALSFAAYVVLNIPLPSRLLPLMAIPVGITLGGIYGILQWLEFRQHARHGQRWITANVLAWPPTMGLLFAGTALFNSAPSLASLGLSAVTGFGAGAVLGAVSGLFLRRMPPN